MFVEVYSQTQSASKCMVECPLSTQSKFKSSCSNYRVQERKQCFVCAQAGMEAENEKECGHWRTQVQPVALDLHEHDFKWMQRYPIVLVF